MRVWHTNHFENIVFEKGEGCTVWDSSGKSYLDMLSGTWCNVLGHRHPKLLKAIREQTGHLIHIGPSFISNEIHKAFSKLSEILPSTLNRVVFLNTGSEAVELSLKMARAATEKDLIVVISKSYYGATNYALKLSEIGHNVSYLPAVGQVLRLPAPECTKCPIGRSWPCDDFPCLNALFELTEENKHKVAAVIFEPVLGNGGVIVPPSGYGACLKDLTSQCEAIFIAEEVTTGIGRTGRWFGFEHEEIVPDILVLGKAIGAGFPVSATITTDEVEERIGGRLTHVQSHQNDPFSGRIAATVVSIMQDEQLVEASAERGRYLIEGLVEMQSRHACISEVRGRGCMIGIELQHEESERGVEVAKKLQELGFIINYQPWNAAFRLLPPYIISKQEIDSFLEAFDKSISITIG